MVHSFRQQVRRSLFVFRKSAALFLILANILPAFAAFAQELPPPPPPAPPASTTPATPLPAPTPAPSPTPTPAPAPSQEPEATPPPSPNSLETVDERLTPVDVRDPLRRAQEPSPTDGSFSYSYPFRTPPGRNAIQPNLALRYNSSAGTNQDLFGYGWSINIPYIQLINRKGIDSAYLGDSTPFFYSSEDGELATTSSGSATSYGAKVENGDFRQYTYSTTTGWIVTDKNGNTYRYGTTTASRQDKPTDTTKIYKWMLEEVRDPSGNNMYYSYYKAGGQIYPSKITYTNTATGTGVFAVEFQREARLDAASSSAFGFMMTSPYRINEIDAEINGSYVTKYVLAYTTGDNGSRSLLSSITETGKDENGNTIALPATSFNYQALTSSQKTWTQDSNWSLPLYFTNGTSDEGARLGEANGDGLIDVLYFKAADTGGKRTYKNGGALVHAWTDAGMVIPLELADGSRDSGVRVLDVNGDGFGDLVKAKAGTGPDVEINNGNDTGWTSSSTWVIPVKFVSSDGLTDYGVRFGDVNGDGLVDMVQALQASSTGHHVFINNGNGTGWTLSQTWGVASSEDFTDGTKDLGVRLEDVDNDGLVDAVDNGHYVYRNKGDGTGWNQDLNWIVPEAFALSGGQDTGARLVDVNGDGYTDLIRSYHNGSATTTAKYINTGSSCVSFPVK